MVLLLHCSDCGFKIETPTHERKKVLKIYREHLITAKLFGCSNCVEKLTNRIEKLSKSDKQYIPLVTLDKGVVA